MACRCPSSGSYTVVIIPLKSALYSLDALRFYLWIKRLKDLEQEKDVLWCGLDVLDKARLWYLQRLQQNRQRQDHGAPTCSSEADSCLQRCRIQRANGSLGSVMNEPNVTSSNLSSLPEAVIDSALRWHNTVLTQEVSDMNHHISLLQREKDALVEQLEDLQAH
ncbi:suppressor APC domain-containing protein 1-like [Eucyclogobius newberryi]|uniref:suppressor APC domain-containing protein 1-like n=1 Tax=Eucyclogobius newberryi TaxID=166745 RepID=UPI003B5A1E33